MMEVFLFTTMSRPALGPTKPPIQCVAGALTLGVKQPGHEAENSPPFCVEVKNGQNDTFTHTYIFMVWCLIKHWKTFTEIIYLKICVRVVSPLLLIWSSGGFYVVSIV
jgi:hypothetical protein